MQQEPQMNLTYVDGIPGYILPIQMEYPDISYLSRWNT